MKLLHKKSKCCQAKIVRFGGQRRQCTACKKTWRVHPSKQGAKHLRKQDNYLKKVFNHGFKVKQLALHSRLSTAVVYKRFAENLDFAISQKRVVRIRGSKLILVIDAKWQYFKGELWTLYFIAIKSVSSETVTVLDPVLRLGKENAASWNEIINQLPTTVKRRTFALVSDGIRGIETVATNHHLIIQRCHFHLLNVLQKMRGKRASTHGRLVREEIYCLVKIALREKSKRKLNALCKRLATLSKKEGCPYRMGMAVRDFLRRVSEFRSYLKYPELNLPTTTNAMESINSYTKRKSPTLKTPKSWHKWAVACIRFKSKFICK